MKTIHLLPLIAVCLTACATPIVNRPRSTPSATPTPTVDRPAATVDAPSATPTPDAAELARASVLPLVAPCDFYVRQPVSFSPSGEWAIVTCQGDNPTDGFITKVVRLDGSGSWSLSYRDAYLAPYFPNDIQPGALLEQAFIPAGWTSDEQFAYLAVQLHDGGRDPFAPYAGLFRLDLASGQLRPTLKPAVAPLSAEYSFEFSPSVTRLAYLNQSVRPLTLVVYDTVSGEETSFKLDARFSQGGGLAWSPDEKQLLVSVQDNGANGGNDVILYNLETLENKYLVQRSERIYLPLEWTAGNSVYAWRYPGEWVYIDLFSGEVLPAPPPTPGP